MPTVILNAFSLNMLDLSMGRTVHIAPLSLAEARELAVNAASAVGHADTAAVFSSQLLTPVACVRATVELNGGQRAMVGQYKGPRLPEGATSLPDGASIVWCLVTVD